MADPYVAPVTAAKIPVSTQLPESKCAAMRIIKTWPQVYGSAYPPSATSFLAEGFQCGPGWYPLIERLSADIAAVLDEMPLAAFRVLQVKQKFGGLRFRVTGSNERILNRIAQAQVEAAHTCEGCGHPSRIRSVDMWLIRPVTAANNRCESPREGTSRTVTQGL